MLSLLFFRAFYTKVLHIGKAVALAGDQFR